MAFVQPSLSLLAGKRVLITGAGGFIGRKLALRLLDAGAEVHGTSRCSRTHHDLPIRWWQGTLDHPDTTRRLLGTIRPDLVFHLAGMVSASNDIANVIPTLHSLAVSTVNLLTVAADLGTHRTVVIGSSNEPVRYEPNSPYAAAKTTATLYARMFYQLYRHPVVIARPFVGYGPGQPADKLIPYVMSQLTSGQRPRLSSGRWKTDWIYIDDLVEGILRCAIVPGIEGCTIDIGTGELASVREIVETIVELLEPSVAPQFGALPDRYAEHTPYADTEYTWEKIRWKPAVGLYDGLRKTVEDFVANGAQPVEVKRR